MKSIVDYMTEGSGNPKARMANVPLAVADLEYLIDVLEDKFKENKNDSFAEMLLKRFKDFCEQAKK